MMIRGLILKIAAAAARLDRERVGSNRNRCLREFTGKIRLAIIWRIPVGFEDDMGFHLGVQPARENDRMEQAGILADAEHF